MRNSMFVLVPFCLSAWVRFGINIIVMRLCTGTILHAKFHVRFCTWARFGINKIAMCLCSRTVLHA